MRIRDGSGAVSQVSSKIEFSRGRGRRGGGGGGVQGGLHQEAEGELGALQGGDLAP